MTAELHDSVIAAGHLQDFVVAWLKGVVPLRERFCFRIEGAWTIPSGVEESRQAFVQPVLPRSW